MTPTTERLLREVLSKLDRLLDVLIELVEKKRGDSQ